jgi:hypothetical protein
LQIFFCHASSKIKIRFVFLFENLIRIEIDMVVGFVVAGQQAVVVPAGKESIRLGNPFDEPVNNTYGFTGRTRSKRVDHLEWT